MLSHLRVLNFRGVKEREFRFGRITLLSGRNGLGKTTVFDAIDWCLFAGAWRLADAPESIENLYDAAEPRVELVVTHRGGLHTIERTRDGASFDGQPLGDAELVQRFITDGDVFEPYSRNIDSRVRQLVYLSQSNIRDLLSAENAPDRAGLFASITGVPHATLVSSSIRRVKERLAQRLKENDDEAARADDEMTALEQSALSTVNDESLDRVIVFAAAAHALAVPPHTLVSAVDVSAKLRDAEVRTEDEIRRLGDLNAELARALETIAALRTATTKQAALVASAESVVDEQRHSVTVKREAAETSAAAARASATALRDASTRLDAAQAQLRLYGELKEVSARLDRLSRRASDLQQISLASSAQMADLTKQIASISSARASAVARVAHLSDSIKKLRDASEARARVRAREASERADDIRQTINRWDEAIASVQQQHAALFARMQSASELHQSVLALCNQLRSLLDRTEDTGCPLCGNDYGSHGELLGHIDRTSQKRFPIGEPSSLATKLGEMALEVDRLRSIREAEYVKLRAAEIDAVDARDEDVVVSAEIKELEAQLNEDRAKLLENEESSASLAAAYDASAEAIRSATAELEELTGNAAQLQGRRDSILSAIGQATLERAVEAVSVASAAKETAEREHARLEAEWRQVLQAATDAEADLRVKTQALTDAKAQLKSDEEVLLGKQSAFEAMSGSPLGLADEKILVDARERLEAAHNRQLELQACRKDMEKVVAHDQSALARRQLAVAKGTQDQLRTAREQIERAIARFEVVAESLARKASEEGADAFVRYADAIQRCIDALYPHRHLNRVILGTKDGSLFVTDEMLGKSVEPDSYSSTGQVNALALATFLGIASTQSIVDLNAVLLDEPIQNLDDIHFLAFVTLLKRIALTSQVVISTADSNTATLIHAQMQSSWANEDGDFVHYRWEDFDAKAGPSIVDVPVTSAAVA